MSKMQWQYGKPASRQPPDSKENRMPFQPRFSYTHSMVRNLGLIESARAVVEVLPLPPDRVLWLRQAARQRATRNSTRIERGGVVRSFRNHGPRVAGQVA
jgi:hypothetical protein